jgi:hypothetical protein
MSLLKQKETKWLFLVKIGTINFIKNLLQIDKIS